MKPECKGLKNKFQIAYYFNGGNFHQTHYLHKIVDTETEFKHCHLEKGNEGRFTLLLLPYHCKVIQQCITLQKFRGLTFFLLTQFEYATHLYQRQLYYGLHSVVIKKFHMCKSTLSIISLSDRQLVHFVRPPCSW